LQSGIQGFSRDTVYTTKINPSFTEVKLQFRSEMSLWWTVYYRGLCFSSLPFTPVQKEMSSRFYIHIFPKEPTGTT
jgi:hypothetical protein